MLCAFISSPRQESRRPRQLFLLEARCKETGVPAIAAVEKGVRRAWWNVPWQSDFPVGLGIQGAVGLGAHYLDWDVHSVVLYDMYIYIYGWQRIKNIGLVAGLGGHFATKVCNRRECSATNPSATSPLKTTVLYTEVRDKGLQQRARNKGL